MISLFLLATGCNSKDPKPELKDPIYKAIQAEISKYKAEIDTNKKNLEVLEKDLSKAQDRTREKKILVRDIQKARKRLLSATQKFEYYQIRLLRRQAEDRINYEISRESGKVWPDPQEEEYFITNQRLKNPELRAKSLKRAPAAKK